MVIRAFAGRLLLLVRITWCWRAVPFNVQGCSGLPWGCVSPEATSLALQTPRSPAALNRLLREGFALPGAHPCAELVRLGDSLVVTYFSTLVL